MNMLRKTLSKMPVSLSNQLFSTGVGLITHNAVSKVLQKFCLENKIGKYTLHSIRHTHCSYLLHNDVSIYYISNILRLAMKKSMTIDFFIAIFYSYREK